MLASWLVLALVAQSSETGTSTAAKPAAGGLTKLPVLLRYVDAPYPEAALREKREGMVLLAIDVDAAGVVQRVEVLEHAGEDFDRAAMQAAAGFVFSPAEAGELGPVPVRISYRYGFVLRPPPPPVATSTAAASEQPPLAGAGSLPRPPINFSGLVKEAGFRIPVSLAEVEVSISTTSTNTRTSTMADENGRFAFRGLPPGRHVVTIRAPLFDRLDAKEELRAGEALEVLYYLTRREKSPYEVVVRAKIERKEIARRTLVFEEIERIPGTQGDAIRVIQNLPGVARTPFGLGLLVVRGAPPQDTGVFLDGHRMPLLFHFGGIGGVTSVLNSRMLESIDFYPGGFGARQGRVSAGAVELKSKLAATDRVHGEAVVDVAGASVFLEGPVSGEPEDGAFTLALRRSYIDGVFAGILSAADASIAIAPRYWDYQARYDRPLGDQKTMLTLFAYGSDDEFVLVGAAGASGMGTPDGTQSRTYFHRFNPRITYTPNKDTSFVFSPIFGIDSTNAQTTGDPSGNAIRLLLEDFNVGFRADGKLRLADRLKLTAGVDALYFDFVSESSLPALPRAKDFPGPIPTDLPFREDSARVIAYTAAIYAELELELFEGLTLWPGIRSDVYSFVADEQPLIDPRLVEGRVIAGVDPRLTVRYELSDALALEAQAGVYNQPALPPQYYVNADLPLQTVDQLALGFDWRILDRLSLDLQGFYRYGYDVARATREVEVVDGRVRPVGFVPDQERRAYGLELLLKLEKRWGLNGWIAYTLSRSEFRRPEQDWAASFFFDQTHNLTAVASYELGLDWFVSARFRFVTGGGLPKTDERWYDADRDQYDRDLSLDLRRAPPFHQLDIRVDKRWVFDEWYLEAYLDLQNVYNQTNTEAFVQSFDFKNDVAIPSLPIFPVLGVKGVF